MGIRELIRLVLRLLTRTVYRLHLIGVDNIPAEGPALLVPNHVSFADPFFIAASCPRPVRFLMFRELYEKPLIKPFVKFMGVIPISQRDTPKDTLKSLLAAREQLKAGNIVCIFAEGEISRVGGAVLAFKRGLEVITKGLDVPIIPTHLEGVWGSIFSFQSKRFIWKWPKKLPYPITVSFGRALRGADVPTIRQSVLDLSAEAFSAHRRRAPTLFDALLRKAAATPGAPAAADSMGREVTYHRLLTGAALLGKRLRRLVGERGGGNTLGLLLPPSVGAMLANVAATGEGLTPVNLNYTLSPEGVADVCARAGARVVVTARALLEKLNWPERPEYVFIEDLLLNIPAGEKAATALALRLLPRALARRVFFPRASRSRGDLATVMFTSGSTGVPKGVMLTQENILSNVEAVAMVLQLDRTDVLLGVLPYFHSFGYLGALWFPLLAGFRVVLHSNPLDVKKIGDLCRAHGVTFLFGTPTFFAAYLRRAPKEDFATLRFAVAGAEKLQRALAVAFEEKFGVPVLEGYGCTELSPVVAVNVPNVQDGSLVQIGRKPGKIGRPIPGVSVRVVDPETFGPLKRGESGLLLVKGPNVMKGYLDDPAATADVVKDGWYVTGDIATIDDDGFIELTDRLSRFSKIGGEMVPLILIEQRLHELAGVVERRFVVTSVADERKGERLIVLCAGFEGDVDKLWRDLRESGLPKLWVPAREDFFVIDALPVLGSGKLDMRLLKKIAGEKAGAG